MVREISFSELAQLISDHSGIDKNKISKTTRIGEDLLILGDDANELFMGINHDFGTDFSNIDLSDFFPNECSADMICYEYKHKEYKYLLCKFLDMPFKLFWRIFKSSKKYKTLTVGELFEAVKKGKWT